MVYRNVGVSGYVGKSNMMKNRRRRRGYGAKKGRKFAKKVVKIIENNNKVKNVETFIADTRAQAAVNTCGTQSIVQLSVLMSGNDVNAIRGAINGQYTTNANIGSFTVDAWMCQIVMNNAGQTNTIVDIYECRPRVAVSNISVVTAITNFTGQMTGASSDSTVWGWTPYQCPPFCQMYKILRKYRYTLAPGASEIIEYRDRRPKRVELAKYYGIAGATGGTNTDLPQYTKIFFAIVRGVATHDNTTKTLVSTSSFDVDFAIREDYHYSYDPNNLAPAIGKSGAFGAITQEAGILIDTGAVLSPPVQS